MSARKRNYKTEFFKSFRDGRTVKEMANPSKNVSHLSHTFVRASIFTGERSPKLGITNFVRQ